MKSDVVRDIRCAECGGIHYGSVGCPYATSICGICQKPLLEHDSYMYCEGGAPELPVKTRKPAEPLTVEELDWRSMDLTAQMVCKVCHQTKMLAEMERGGSKGWNRICKPCAAPRARLWVARRKEKIREADRLRYQTDPARRQQIRERRLKNKGTPKELARIALRHAVTAGKVVKPTNCQRCSKELPPARLQGHHHDYSKPLEVEWICAACHGKAHCKYV